MGIDTLPTRGATTIMADWFNSIHSALKGTFLPRGPSGVPENEGGSLGSEDCQWANIRTKNLFIDGALFDPTESSRMTHRILSGKATATGYPNFLTAAGSGNGLAATIEGATTNLVAKVDSDDLFVTTDQQWLALTAAPSSNNTCLSTFDLGDEVFSKNFGEYEGGYLEIGTVGSAITALNGKIAAFKKDNEVMLAKIDTTNGRIYPVHRGWAGTSRETLAGNDALTLLKISTLLIRADQTRVATTYFPETVDEFPAAGTAGKVYVLRSNGRTGYDDGTTVQTDFIIVGWAICDSVDCKWVQPVDFDLSWSGHSDLRMVRTSTTSARIIGGSSVSVAGNLIRFQRDVDVTHAADMDDSETMSANLDFFLYVTGEGAVVISPVFPVCKSSTTFGYYHPTKYYRCIASVPTGSSTDWQCEPFPLDGADLIRITLPATASDVAITLPPPFIFLHKKLTFLRTDTGNGVYSVQHARDGTGLINVYSTDVLMSQGDFFDLEVSDEQGHFRNWFLKEMRVSADLTTAIDNLFATDPYVSIHMERRRGSSVYGDVVSISMPGVPGGTKSGTTAPNTATTLPSRFIPTSTQYVPILINHSSGFSIGYLMIQDNGYLVWARLAGWTNGQSAAIETLNVNYSYIS